MKKLKLILDQLESHIPNFEKTNPRVSESTIGWQIDHSLLVINRVIDQLKGSNPENYKWKLSLYVNGSNTPDMIFRFTFKNESAKGQMVAKITDVTHCNICDIHKCAITIIYK